MHLFNLLKAKVSLTGFDRTLGQLESNLEELMSCVRAGNCMTRSAVNVVAESLIL